jgi:flagellar motility protein MotE (MotC chaperone)
MADKVKKPKKDKVKKEKIKKEKPDKNKGGQTADGGDSSGGEGKSPKGGGGILFSIISLLSALVIIVVVLSGFLFLIIKMNLLGVADTYKEPISKVPLLNLALPVVAEPEVVTIQKVTKENEALQKENANLVKREEGMLTELEELRKFKDEYTAKMMVAEEKERSLTQQVTALETDKKKYEDTRYEIDRMVAEGDKEGFAKYFETVDPTVAREIYAQIIKEQSIAGDAKDFIKLYEAMDPAVTAGIFEEMGQSRMDLIVECLKGMKRETTTEILTAMSKEFATAVTLRLADAFS